jgi:hypothetical protein
LSEPFVTQAEEQVGAVPLADLDAIADTDRAAVEAAYVALKPGQGACSELRT